MGQPAYVTFSIKRIFLGGVWGKAPAEIEFDAL